MSSDLTFITNEPGKSLCDRFGVLFGQNTRFFDCLVGYFFLSGFHRLHPSLVETEKIRILVGIRTDRDAAELIQSAARDEVPPSRADIRRQLPGDILNELEQSRDTREIEDGVRKFVEWLRSGKMEVRAYPSHRLHAKLYIMTFREGDRDKGRVITGSSNFTQAGLADNLEFNVELKNASDYDFALAKFNELWEQGEDVTMDYADTIENKSPYAQFSPHELYLKFLYEYFRTELSLPENLEDIHLPDGFKKLKYQEEAVLNARKILDEYGGVFLADVVGLGKTYMAALLARHLDTPCLVIAPPHLLDKHNPGSWSNVFDSFDVRSPRFESIGKLRDLLNRNLDKYTTVFIDESHRFRTENSQSYDLLAQICRGKRVVLVSATPLNNTPQDILSQIKLFQPCRNSTIPNVRNLEEFFGKMRRRLEGLDRQDDRDEYLRTVRDNAKETRESVLKFLMIRRTRAEIEKYYGTDLAKQGLKFPEVANPEPLFYAFNKVEAELFDKTIRVLTRDVKYARYMPWDYYIGMDVTQQDIQGQRNLASFMKILAVKRLESSFAAFRATLGRFIATYERVIAEFHKGFVYISRKHTAKLFELLESDDQEGVDRLLEEDKAKRFAAAEFRPEFLADLESDLATLQSINDQWRQIDRDPKWESFRDILKQNPLLNDGKVIIFTESKETADYLAGRIRNEVEPGVLLFTGASLQSARGEVIANFDAKAYQCKDNFRILVATEVLAEGVNLHRSNVVINYDIPWNPTRLIQRVGRVNRVDTTFSHIYTYNFFPTDEGNSQIKLREAAEAKIHAFIQMLGADAKLLTESEEIVSHDLFARWNSKKTITGEDENEVTELKFLDEIRSIRDQQPELYNRIKRLPKKARSTRMSTQPTGPDRPALLTYFRRGNLDKFFLGCPGGVPATELDFLSTATLLKPDDPGELRQHIPHEFYDHLEQNRAAFTTATTTEESVAIPRNSQNDAYILKRLKDPAVRHGLYADPDDADFVKATIRLVEDGSLPKGTSKKVADALKNPENLSPPRVLAVLRQYIKPGFFQTTPSASALSTTAPREVILSSWLTANPPAPKE